MPIAWRVVAGLLVCVACDEPKRDVAPVVDASAEPPPAPPPREGCVRSGPLSSLETDPACVVHRSDDGLRALMGAEIHAVMKHIEIEASIEPTEVNAGAEALVHLVLKNTSTTETTLILDARPRPAGPRPDFARMHGVPEIKGVGTDTPHLFFPVQTMDARDRDVDALPVVENSGAQPVPTTLAVRLLPGSKLTHAIPWWALSIPAPAPIYKDDAGHRYVPKTSAHALPPGDYSVVVELPIWGLTREERKVAIHVHVVRPPLMDGGVAPSWMYP